MASHSQWFRDIVQRSRAVRAEATGWGRYGIKPPRRERAAIVTDSSCSLPADVLTLPVGSHLRTVPMPVMVGDQIYSEGTEELSAQLPLALAAGTAVKTSRPAPGAFADAYTELAREGYGSIIAVVLSGRLSGTADAARLAAGESRIPVQVIDSETTGMALGTAVLDGLLRSRNGLPAEEMARLITTSARASRVFFTVPNLEQLRRGGRIGALAGLLGQLLQVKPVLTLNNGAVALLDRPRTTARAIDSLIRQVRQETAQRPSRVAVHGYGNMDAAHELAGRLAADSTLTVPVIPLPAVLAAHLGLGALGVTVSPDFTLPEFLQDGPPEPTAPPTD
ncbi:DegV family protein [Citricoccus sp. NR2]|uniref:DegV family protein n=1 Tax=Citricoccus sp. NR2 TaxID=3004095 RepID=UPI0022DD6A53|nr:DegV family protein [Citricoccus sp. NR2]WBL18210.1 DegV family protein [Citricoccus sp. NR2]